MSKTWRLCMPRPSAKPPTTRATTPSPASVVANLRSRSSARPDACRVAAAPVFLEKMATWRLRGKAHRGLDAVDDALDHAVDRLVPQQRVRREQHPVGEDRAHDRLHVVGQHVVAALRCCEYPRSAVKGLRPAAR